MTERPIGEDDLHGYVDGQLPPARHAEVAAWLERNPDAAARVRAYADQRTRIADALAGVLDEPVPLALNLRAVAARRRSLGGPFVRHAVAAAAAFCLVFAGGLGGWSLREWSQPVPRGIAALAQEAASSYAVYAPDRERPIELAASQRQALDGWLSARLGHSVRAPDLGASGYRLLGGRLVATPHGPAAMFLYQNAAGARVAMLVREMTIDRTAAMRRNRIDGTDGYAWADGGIGFSLVGPESAGDLNPLADEARRQMSGIARTI